MESLMKECVMERRLEELARQLEATRKRGNKLTLQSVLESARILEEAESLAKRRWTRWVRERGHMDPVTARRHMAVADFVRANRALTHEIATLSIAKIYKLSTLESALAVSLLTGKQKLSLPLDRMSDVQFRQECQRRFPAKPKKANRGNVFRSTLSILSRAEKSLHRALHYARRMTHAQRRRIYERVTAISTLLSDWKVVA